MKQSSAAPTRDAEKVHAMFSSISSRYDLANDVLSFGVHRYWRRRAVAASKVKAGDRVVDCAAGTGDLSLAFARVVGSRGHVMATDFCADMLQYAPGKAARAGLSIQTREADAMALPFADASYDVASMAFGIRNVADPVRCLRELGRVVRPGGRVVVLEFGQPTGAFGALYRFYSRHVMPPLGGLLTGDASAYQYLPETAAAFPSGAAFLHLMDQAGAYADLQAFPLLAATAWIYVGVVKANP